MQTIEQIAIEMIANKDRPSPAWRRDANGEWAARLGDAILTTRQQSNAYTVIVYCDPIEEKRTAYSNDLGSSMDLAAQIADYRAKNCHCLAEGFGLCCCNTDCVANHCECGEHSEPDCPQRYCGYCCRGWARLTHFHRQNPSHELLQKA